MLETVLEPAIKAPSAPMVELINGKALPKVLANKALFRALLGFLVCNAAAIKALITNNPPGKYKGLELALISASPKTAVKSNVTLVSKDSNPANTLEQTSKSATSK